MRAACSGSLRIAESASILMVSGFLLARSLTVSSPVCGLIAVMVAAIWRKLPEKTQRELVRRVFTHVTQENKRKNLIGEGFEDTIAALLKRVPGIARAYDI